MLVFPQMDPTNFSLENSTQGGPLTFKMETKQQEPQEEETPILAMTARKISRKKEKKDLQKALPSVASTL